MPTTRGAYETAAKAFDTLQFARVDIALEAIRGELKLLRWMMALIIVTTVVPVLQRWFTGFVLY